MTIGRGIGAGECPRGITTYEWVRPREYSIPAEVAKQPQSLMSAFGT
jgi:hypothetical protein